MSLFQRDILGNSCPSHVLGALRIVCSQQYKNLKIGTRNKGIGVKGRCPRDDRLTAADNQKSKLISSFTSRSVLPEISIARSLPRLMISWMRPGFSSNSLRRS